MQAGFTALELAASLSHLIDVELVCLVAKEDAPTEMREDPLSSSVKMFDQSPE